MTICNRFAEIIHNLIVDCDMVPRWEHFSPRVGIVQSQGGTTFSATSRLLFNKGRVLRNKHRVLENKMGLSEDEVGYD